MATQIVRTIITPLSVECMGQKGQTIADIFTQIEFTENSVQKFIAFMQKSGKKLVPPKSVSGFPKITVSVVTTEMPSKEGVIAVHRMNITSHEGGSIIDWETGGWEVRSITSVAEKVPRVMDEYTLWTAAAKAHERWVAQLLNLK